MGTIERGESNLSLSSLAKVAQGLGITLSQFLSGIEKRVEGVRTADGEKIRPR
jgi:transcriptional regulator with XRE-family HTH domain